MKEAPENSLSPSATCGDGKSRPCVNEEASPLWTLDSQASGP